MIPEAKIIIVSYSVCAVKIYNATSMRFENKNIFFYYQKTLFPIIYNAGAVVVVSKAVVHIGT
jgi:hypothetical protein